MWFGLTGLRTSTLWAIGAILILVLWVLIFPLALWLLNRVGIADVGPSRVLHDTYYVVAHAHTALVLVALFGAFAGWYYAFPRITGYACSDFLSKLHFWLAFVGVNVMLVPQIVLLASPARVVADPAGFRRWNVVSLVGTYIVATGMLIFLGNMVLAFVRRERAE